MEQRIISRRNAACLLAVILAVTFLPWLGDTLFNTKGEPREALVAVSMLQSGNYILPESYGADIPYKPPFLAWLIAGASWLTGGTVTELTSRLPSAIATIAMVMAGFLFFTRRRTGTSAALAMALVTITSVEVYRAATACRVDMVLTACTVTSIYTMAALRERKGRIGVSWAAVVLMTMAVLTKGPVGAGLPCLMVWTYSLLRGDKLWRATLTMALSGFLALLLPAAWYYAAWTDGGERFLNLAIEENIGRLTGTMSYDSHVNPWYYNILTILAGMAPYTLLALMALFTVRRVKPDGGMRGLWERFRALDPDTLLAVSSAVVIFVFYCFPKSKRSVYLLPMYPFMAWLVTQLIIHLVRSGHRKVLAAYASVIASAGILAAFVVASLHIADVRPLLPDLKGTMLDLVNGLHGEAFGIADLTLLTVCILTCGATLLRVIRRRHDTLARGAIASALAVYLVLGATVLPRTLNAKSDIVLAREIKRLDTGLPVYSYNAVKMLRYYTAAFYLNDGIRLFAPEEGSSQTVKAATPASLPEEGLLIVNTLEMPQWQELYGKGYTVDTLYTGTRRSSDCRAVPMIVKFSR